MGAVIGALFGKKSKSSGIDPETRAAQRRQDQRLQKKEAEESREKQSRERAAKARSGGRVGLTLFSDTGEAGVPSTLGG